MSVGYGPKLITEDLSVYLEPGNLKSYSNHLYTNKINPTTWSISSGSETGFNQNGVTAENARVYGEDPWGNQAILWEATPESDSGSDGGWNTPSFAIDNTQMYRFSTWIRRTVRGTNGTNYLGCNGYGSTNGVYRRSSGANNNTNPYFYTPGYSTLPENVWVLIVGHVWPAGSGAGSNHTDSGRYSIAGGKLGNISYDFIWRAESTTTRHRSYLYYCTDTNVKTHWFGPRVDIVDGTEPSLQDLLDGKQDAIHTATDQTSIKAYRMNSTTRSTDFGGMFTMDGAKDYISCPNILNTQAIGASSKITISMWLRVHTLGTKMAFSTGQTTNDRIYYWTDEDQNTWRVGDYTSLTGHGAVTADEWYNTTLVIDGTNVYVYYNGALDYSGSYTPFTTVDHAVFGRHGNTDNFYYDGDMAAMKIYENKALTQSQVIQNFGALKSRFGL